MPLWLSEAQRAIEIDPLAAEAHALVGDYFSATIYSCKGRREDPELADIYYRHALDLKPDLTIAIENRAANLRHLGRYEECLDLLNRSITRFSDESPFLLNRGSRLVAKGDLAAATRDFEALNRSRIAPIGAALLRGWLEIMGGDIAAGTRDLEGAVATNASPQLELSVASTYARIGEMTPTVVHLRRAFTMDRMCADVVSKSLQFRMFLGRSEIRQILREYGVLLETPLGGRLATAK